MRIRPLSRFGEWQTKPTPEKKSGRPQGRSPTQHFPEDDADLCAIRGGLKPRSHGKEHCAPGDHRSARNCGSRRPGHHRRYRKGLMQSFVPIPRIDPAPSLLRSVPIRAPILRIQSRKWSSGGQSSFRVRPCIYDWPSIRLEMHKNPSRRCKLNQF
jgi:hypothetical protein